MKIPKHRLNKQKIYAIVMSLVILNPLSIYADTVTGIKFINNTDRNIDYKLEDKEVEKVKDKINTSSDHTEVYDEDNGRNINEDDKTISYLIENNIISREEVINFNSNGIQVSNGAVETSGEMPRSEFLMGMYKAIYGPISSRPVVVNTPSVRESNGENVQVMTSTTKPKGYTGSDNKFEYKEGDYETFVSSNVMELYLSELLNKSIISSGELVPAVADEIQSRGTSKAPAWDPSLPVYKPLEGGDSSNAGLGTPLGRSFFMSSYPSKVESAEVKRDYEAQYFNNEKIQTIEALELIEDVLRLTEKNLSEAEANMVAYKYGTSYILDFPKETRSTITYLIAMGVLDFENPGEFGNIYDDLSDSFAYDLMYRLHNKSGRKDFTKIQLTDSEDQLLKEGFIEQKLTNVENFEGAMPSTLSVNKSGQTVPATSDEGTSSLDVEDEDSSNSPTVEMTMNTPVKRNSLVDKVFATLGFEREDRGVKFATGKTKTTSHEVVKIFLDLDNTRYKGTRISLLQTNGDDIKSIEDVDGGKKITFVVNAPSEVQAVASIDSRITITSNASKNKGNVNTITQVNTEGGKVSYISAKELGNKVSEISVINSKTLKNKTTGDMAMLLKDHKLALVGNTIIKSGADMVTRLNGVEYYNLDMIMPLMTNAYISKIDPSMLYTKVKLPEEQIVEVRGTGNNVIEHTPITKLGSNQEDAENPLINKEDSKYFFNLNLITRGVSTLIRDFEIQASGKKTTAKVIVNWHYSLPKTNSKTTEGKLIEDPKIFHKAQQDDSEFSIKEATDYLYTRPSSGALQDWWDNNIELSNGIANLMYGTTDKPQRYVSSGYMTPSIDILVYGNDLSDDTIAQQIFAKMKLPSSYVSKYIKGNIRNFHKELFNGTGDGLNARRTFNVYRSAENSTTQGIVSFADNYVTYPTGAVYKRVFGDSRLQFVISDTERFIELHTRAKETMQRLNTPQKVEVVGSDGTKQVMWFSGYSGDGKKPNGNFIRLTTMEPVKGTAKKDGDNWTIVNGEGKDVIDEYITNVQKFIPAGLMRSDVPANLRTSIPPEGKYTQAGTIKNVNYIVLNSLKEIDKKANGDYSVKTVDKTDKETYAHPTIYLRRSEFKFKKISNGTDGAQYRLVMERTNPFLETSNVFYSGLNSSLISRILDEDTDAVPLSKLPAGSKVMLAGYNWTKVGNKLHSDPISDQTTVNNIQQGVMAQKSAKGLDKEILNLFQGISLTYSGREADGTNGQSAFTSYVTSTDLGGISHLEDEQVNNTLFKQGTNVKLARAKDDIINATSNSTPSSLTIAIATDNNVLYRLIDKENKVYELVMSSDRYGEGYLDDVSMFYETLDLGLMDDVFLTLQGNKFFKLDDTEAIVNQMMQEYVEALRGDGVQLLKQVAVVILSLAIVMSWLVYGILQLNVGKNILLSLREALETTTSKGLDVIKLATFGMLSLDSELKSSTFFVGNLAMFIMLYFVLNRF